MTLVARFEYSLLHARIQTLLRGHKYSFFYLLWAVLLLLEKTEFIYIIMCIENLLLISYSGVCNLNQNFKGINYIPQRRFLRK